MRFENWPELLAAFNKEAGERSFVWGEWDCCLMAGKWVDMATGSDEYKLHAGKYATSISGYRYLKSMGGLDGLAARMGLCQIAPLLAQRGDLALMEGGAMGVVIGRDVLVPALLGGAIPLPLVTAAAAWRVA